MINRTISITSTLSLTASTKFQVILILETARILFLITGLLKDDNNKFLPAKDRTEFAATATNYL